MKPARNQRRLKFKAVNNPPDQDNGITGMIDTVPEIQNKLKVIVYTPLPKTNLEITSHHLYTSYYTINILLRHSRLCTLKGFV